eukprot:4198573-Heterocapsa_arctica.AAC.1
MDINIDIDIDIDINIGIGIGIGKDIGKGIDIGIGIGRDRHRNKHSPCAWSGKPNVRSSGKVISLRRYPFSFVFGLVSGFLTLLMLGVGAG